MNSQGKKGFTLIEMLTVIVIIVILAGILLPVVSKAFARAKRAQARQDVASIKAAVDAYYTEYGRLPLGLGLSPNTLAASNTTLAVYAGLMASTNAIPTNSKHYSRAPRNPKAYVFLEGSTLTDEGVFVDPWGSQYLLQMAGRDGIVSVRFASGVTNYYLNVVAKSLGPDRRDFTEDDVLSVQTD